MSVSHVDMFLAHLGLVMTDFHKSKWLFNATVTRAIPQLEGPDMQSYSTLICTYLLKPMICTSMLPICLDGTVLTRGYGSVGKQNIVLAIWSMFNVAKSLTNH